MWRCTQETVLSPSECEYTCGNGVPDYDTGELCDGPADPIYRGLCQDNCYPRVGYICENSTKPMIITDIESEVCVPSCGNGEKYES
jgi:hypothetical protein